MTPSDEVNEPEFPSMVWVGDDDYETIYHLGMTFRDYFAAKAMQALLRENSLEATQNWSATLANVSYSMADAMLAQRNKLDS